MKSFNFQVKKIDFASLASVRSFAKEILENEDKIHILVNNAGAAGLGDSKSEDGNHIGLQVNHFGPFLLTNLLLGILLNLTCNILNWFHVYLQYLYI